MIREFTVWATSSPTGLSIIGRRVKNSSLISDVYVTKMVMSPESGERYFSFSPINPLAQIQAMLWSDFEALANRGVHCGLYHPAGPVIEAYLRFVDSEERKDFMTSCYTEECGPSKEWLEKRRAESGQEPSSNVEREGKVIKGAFACVEEE